MGQNGVEDRLAAIEDELAIRGLLERYCDGVSIRNWEQVADCYLEDASLQEVGHVPLKMVGRDEILRTTSEFSERSNAFLLMMHSCRHEKIDADHAKVFTLCHTRGENADGSEYSIFGRFEDNIERRDGQWFFGERVFRALQWRLPANFEEQTGIAPETVESAL